MKALRQSQCDEKFLLLSWFLRKCVFVLFFSSFCLLSIIFVISLTFFFFPHPTLSLSSLIFTSIHIHTAEKSPFHPFLVFIYASFPFSSPPLSKYTDT